MASAMTTLLIFLSCLHGSERVVAGVFAGHVFLSCLHGSERYATNNFSAFYISELPARQ